MAKTLRQKFGIDRRFDSDEGSISTHAAAATAGALAVAVTMFLWGRAQQKETITIDAKVVADVIELPASMNVVSIFGGSSTNSSIGIDVGVGVGPLSRDISVGSIPFETAVYGENSLEYQVLKDPKDPATNASAGTETAPDPTNVDKYMKVTVEQENGRDVLVVLADVAGLTANT